MTPKFLKSPVSNAAAWPGLGQPYLSERRSSLTRKIKNDMEMLLKLEIKLTLQKHRINKTKMLNYPLVQL